jgi:hypothetical protein
MAAGKRVSKRSGASFTCESADTNVRVVTTCLFLIGPDDHEPICPERDLALEV